MLTDIRVYRTTTDYLTIPIGEADSFILKGVDGLGPAAVAVTENYMVGVDQYAHNRFNTDYRTIGLTIGIEKDYVTGESVQELAQKLYKYFPRHAPITLRFTDDVFGIVEIEARVASLTRSIFTPDPEAVVSLVCPDPYFHAISEIVIANPSPGVIEYSGSAPVGYRFDIVPTGGTVTSINFDGFRIAKTLSVGQRIEVSTVPGDKYVMFYTSSSDATPDYYTKFVNHLTDWSTLLMQPGENDKVMSWTGSSSNPFKNLRWVPKYLSL